MSDLYLPKGMEFWIVFDKSNGDYQSNRYLWWFDSKQEALDFLKDCKQRGVTVTYSRVKQAQFIKGKRHAKSTSVGSTRNSVRKRSKRKGK